MYQLKGFFKFIPLIDNTRDQVAPFGEISDDGLTYAKDKTYHSSNAHPQTVLIGFHSSEDGDYAPVSNSVAERAVQIGQWLLDRALNGQISGDVHQVRNSLQNEFSSMISHVTTGALLEEDDLRLPEWIGYRDIALGDENQIQIWLADASFRRQYDEYDIEIIPPFEPLDDFFQDPILVIGKINDIDFVEKMEEVQARRGEYPYTQLLAQRYDYVHPADPNNRTPTKWVVLVYGQAGNNPDLIRNEIIDYVLENSTRDREEWAVILPDLFMATEYVITPFWHQYSVPNREMQAGIHSPIIKPQESLELLKRTTRGSGFDDAWVAAEHQYSMVIYKSLAFGAVGNAQNRDGIYGLKERFTDYMVVTNQSADFNRMSVRTQDFINLLNSLIQIAETLTPTSDVPVGYARLVRDGVVYITRQYEQVLYLVAGRRSVELAYDEVVEAMNG
jgi:hypothetical protein